MDFLLKDFKRALLNKGFYIPISLLLLIFFHALYINIDFRNDNNTYEIISVAMALSGFTPFAAIFPAMGYSVFFCEEYHSGYINMITSRMTWRDYVTKRIITVGISGGLVISVPFTIICLLAYFCGVHGLNGTGLYIGTRMQYYIENYGDAYILIGKILLGFLFGALWSLVGFAFSVWFCNRYVSLIAPFILYEVMWMLLYDYPILNPIYLLRGDDLESYPLSATMEIVYICITIILIWIGMKRRVNNE